MKRIFLVSTAIIAMATTASARNGNDNYPNNNNSVINIETSYLDGVYTEGGWKSNWFITAQGGLSAFSGKPVGHGDIFDRTTPMLHLAIGKWVSPTVGLRLAFEGFNFKDHNTDRYTMQNIHADMLYNISYLFKDDMHKQPRWNFMPLVGVGLIHNKQYDQKPFAMTFGINIGYRLTEKLMVSAEAANTITWQSFDGVGDGQKLGDNVMQTSLGLTYTIGKAGWRRVVDPIPYILANDLLNERIRILQEENNRLKNGSPEEEIVEQPVTNTVQVRSFPKNNYSGLNALRERMRNKNNTNEVPEFINSDDFVEYTTQNNGEVKGYPIYFFFKKGTAILTNKTQVVNIKELAKAVNKYDMKVVTIGAADAKTGTEAINKRLAAKRSQYLAKQLMSLGVPEEDIIVESRGGIEDYEDLEANRNCCVLMCPREKE